MQPQTYLLVDVAIALGASLVLSMGKSLGALWLGSAMMGVATASMFPPCVSLPQALGISLSGGLTSLFVAGSSVGGLVVPYVLSAAMDFFGPRALFLGMLIIVVAMWALITDFNSCSCGSG